MWLQIIFLAFAVSIDGFGVGMTFGMRKVKIPLKSIAVVSVCSAMSLGIAMVIGEFISQLISVGAAEKTGGIILVLLGSWMVYQYFRPEKETNDERYHEKIIFNFEIKSLGVAINILQKPMNADFDKSGTITGIEALVLGFALSLDAFGAGVGAAMMGISPIILALCIAVMSFIFIGSGLQCGKLLSDNKIVQHLTFLPGLLLILIGLFKL